MKQIGEKLKHVRENAGLSQSQLAKSAGINYRTLQQYEQGTKNINATKLITVYKICNVLGCTLYDILTDDKLVTEIRKYERTRGKDDVR